jgi:hypothetical protein
LVNHIFSALSLLDWDRQTRQILHFLSAESDRAMERKRKEIIKKEEKIAKGKEVKEYK